MSKFKPIFRRDDLSLNKTGERVSRRVEELMDKLLEEFSDYNPRQIENLISHCVGYKVAMTLLRYKRHDPNK